MAKKSMIAKANRTPKHEVQGYNRCSVCGRPRAYMRRFALCRICFRERALVGEVNSLPKTVGGGAVHADMKYPRFQETDFRLASLLGDVPGASFADWPLTYDELEPFYTEAEQIVNAARRNQVPVWYLLADNEGHGYARKSNADYLFYAMTAFVETYVLRETPATAVK